MILFEWNFKKVILKQISIVVDWGITYTFIPKWMFSGTHWWLVTTGSRNRLILSGNKVEPDLCPVGRDYTKSTKGEMPYTVECRYNVVW